jgi:hypothetical protein
MSGCQIFSTIGLFVSQGKSMERSGTLVPNCIYLICQGIGANMSSFSQGPSVSNGWLFR